MEEVQGKSGVNLSKYFLIFIIVVGGLILVFLFFVFSDEKQCGDKTFYDKCSLNKPYFCDNGVLVKKAFLCSCPNGFEVFGEECFSKYKIALQNISLKYNLNKEVKNINLEVYEGFYNYSKNLSRFVPENYSLTDLKKEIVENELQREMLMPLVVAIQNLETKKKEQAKIAISLVQNIFYDDENNNLSFFGQALSARYPYEVLYDEKGVCGEKSLLLVFLLKELGYGTAILHFTEENHDAVGIKCSFLRDYEDIGYCFIETTSLVGGYGEGYFGATQKFSSAPKIIIISDGHEF